MAALHTPDRRPHRGIARVRATSMPALALALLLVLGAGACAGGSDESSPGNVGEAGDRTAEQVADPGSAGSGADSGQVDGAITGPQDASVPAASGRQQTFTASVDLGVERLDRAIAEVADIVEGSGGFVEGEDVDLGDARFARVTYRVPAPEFRRTLEAVGDAGDLRSQQVSSTDVTATAADLESRVATLRTSVDRLRGFLGEASDINQITTLEGELTRRESELESVEAQRRALADQVALSTISVSFDAAASEPDTVDDRDLPSFMGGLETGWDAAVAIAAAVAATIGFLLPFLPVALLVAWFVRLLIRRRRSGEVHRSSPTPEPQDVSSG